MKLPLWVFFNIFVESRVGPILEKLRLYQNITEIDDTKLLMIYEQSLDGKVKLSTHRWRNHPFRTLWYNLSEIPL